MSSLRNGFSFGGAYFQTTKLQGDEAFLAEALKVAMRSCGVTAPNPAVGALVVRDGQVIGSAATERYKSRHAERVLLENFEFKEGDVLYVTLEPCSHYGYQPPCVDLVKKFNWKRVVIGTRDPNPKVAGGGLAALKHLKVTVGPLAKELTAWNYPFFYQQMTGKPLIVAKWAESADGFLADNQGQSKWITCQESRNYVHWLRQKYDCILVGAGTIFKDQPLLNVRHINAIRQPLRIVWDPGMILRSNPWIESSEFQSTGQSTIIIWPEKSKLDGLEVFVSRDNLGEILESETFVQFAGQVLGKPLQSIFVEGGAKTLKAVLPHCGLIHTFKGNKKLAPSSHSSPLALPHNDWQIMSKIKIESDQLLEAIPKSCYRTVFASS